MTTCIRAWHDLGTCRSIGMAAGPIPWTAIVQWCDFFDLDREQTIVLTDVIRHLDNERAAAEAARQRLKAGGG